MPAYTFDVPKNYAKYPDIDVTDALRAMHARVARPQGKTFQEWAALALVGGVGIWVLKSLFSGGKS